MQIEISDTFYEWLESSKKMFGFSNHEEVLLFYVHRYMGLVKMRDSKRMDIPFDVIFNTVANHYGISLEEITTGKKMSKKLPEARYVSRYVAKQITGCTNSDLGRFIKADQSTISHSIAIIDQRIKEDSSLQRLVASLIKQITEQVTPNGN